MQYSLCLTAAALLGLTVAAHAETQWERDHPRRDQVNSRLGNQNARIQQERREGEINGAQAHALHQQDHAIRQEERGMAAQDGGHITRGDKGMLNQQENATSHEIGK